MLIPGIAIYLKGKVSRIEYADSHFINNTDNDIFILY